MEGREGQDNGTGEGKDVENSESRTHLNATSTDSESDQGSLDSQQVLTSMSHYIDEEFQARSESLS